MRFAQVTLNVYVPLREDESSDLTPHEVKVALLLAISALARKDDLLPDVIELGFADVVYTVTFDALDGDAPAGKTAYLLQAAAEAAGTESQA